MLNKFSGLKVLYHLDHVKGTLAGNTMFPVHINIDTTNYCDHNCIWCSGYEGQQKRANDIDSDSILNALRDGRRLGLKAVTHIGTGDPSLHKRFLELTAAIHTMGLDQGMFTHGMWDNGWCDDIVENFTWVRFSLDAGSTEVHDHVHGVGGHYESIMANIERLAKSRKSPDYFTVGVQFVLHQTNYRDMENAAKRVKAAGADYFSIKPVIKRGAVEIRSEKYKIDWDVVQTEITKARSLADNEFEVLYKPYQFQINNVPFPKEKLTDPNFDRKYTKCYAVNFEWWIRNNLDVAICGPMHKTVGNLQHQSFESILNSEMYIDVLNNIKIDKCYRGCRPHYMNQAMSQLEDSQKLEEAVLSLAEPNFRIHKNFVG